eukprot:13649564-Heterocapsa_arctica.AAC.1
MSSSSSSREGGSPGRSARQTFRLRGGKHTTRSRKMRLRKGGRRRAAADRPPTRSSNNSEIKPIKTSYVHT